MRLLVLLLCLSQAALAADADGDGYDTSDDCNDLDPSVFPGAVEVCDGQYNDCDDSSYTATGAPTDETDADADGWVSCERMDGSQNALAWVGLAAEPNVWIGSSSDGCYCPTEAECATVLSYGVPGSGRCIDELGAICAPADCDTTTSAAEAAPVFVRITGLGLVDCDDADANTFPGAAALEGEEPSSPVMVGDEPVACATDADGDYYSGSDCDDTDNTVHPNQIEDCEVGEQVDDDCNNDVNSAWGYSAVDSWNSGTHPELYLDEDVDGFGTDQLGSIKVCELLDGYASNSTDCDDTDSAVYPGADELCDDKDQDCDKAVDEPELNEDSGCVLMFKDQDNDGYGDPDEEVCLCASGNEDHTVNPNDGVTYVSFGGDCNDNYYTIRPMSCADGYDNDGDGFSDEHDVDCMAGMDEYGEAEETHREYLDGHDNDCDGQIPAVELDCDDDGSLPLVPLDAENIDTVAYPEYVDYDEYRDAWEDEGFGTAADLGLTDCDPGASLDLPECLGVSSLILHCDALTDDGTGLWMVAYTDSDDEFGGRYDGGYRSYAAIDGGRLTSEPGDCDDHCALRYPAGLSGEVCDGVDNNCSDVDAGSDGNGIPDALNTAVIVGGTVSLAEADVDGDGALDCDSFSSYRDEVSWSETGCDAIVDEEWLSDSDDTDPTVYGPDMEADDGDDTDKQTCTTGPGPGGLAVILAMVFGIRRRDGLFTRLR